MTPPSPWSDPGGGGGEAKTGISEKENAGPPFEWAPGA